MAKKARKAVPQQGAAPDARRQAVERMGPAGRIVYERLEIIATIVMDGLMLVVAYGGRFLLLALVARFAPPGERHWALTALEFLLDVGLVGTALVMTVFDLVKRLILAARSVKKVWDSQLEA